MKVDFDNKVVKLYKVPIREKISSWIEQDILVPDFRPDAVKIVSVNSVPYVCSYEILENKLKVEGKINYFIVYKNSENTCIGMCFTYSFVNMLNIKNINKNMKICIKPFVKNIIYSLPNERKISVKTEVIFNVCCKEFIDVKLINKFNNSEFMQFKTTNIKLCNYKEYKEAKINSKEDILIPKEAEDFSEIVKYEVKIINTDFKESYNKVMVKGDLFVNLLYLSIKNEFKKFKFEIPFTSMIELEHITDNSVFDITYYLSDFIVNITDNESSKVINASYSIDTFVSVYEDENIMYIDDFYNERSNVRYDEKKYNLVCKNNIINKSFEIKENVNNVIKDGSIILDYSVDTSSLNIKHIDNEVSITGFIKINLLTKNDEIENKIIDIEVNETINIDDISKNSFLDFDILVDKINVLPNGNDIEIRIKLNIEIKDENMININCIDNIEIEEIKEENENSSMYLYIVKKGDTLWNIAKKYKTTVDKIVATNNIENKDEISENEKILIIR